uniref:Uncharacterized protein n=1 Tax=Anguilla anguilla TaxID=7936 RepID=A0A0E9T7Y2_ANGAN
MQIRGNTQFHRSASTPAGRRSEGDKTVCLRGCRAFICMTTTRKNSIL